MVEVAGGDANVVDFEGSLDEVVKTNIGAQFIERDGEIGILHLARERFAQRVSQSSRAIDVPLATPNKQRCKKGNSLNVIPVRVANQQAPPQRCLRICQQRLAEFMRSGARINDDQGTAGRVQLHARGVATIAKCVGAGFGERAAGSPELDACGRLYCGLFCKHEGHAGTKGAF